MTTSNGGAAGAAWMDPAPHPGRLRWLLLFVWVALLPLLLVSGALAIRILDEMHGQQPVVTHALAARTQMLSGLLLSIRSAVRGAGESRSGSGGPPAPRSAHG